MARTEGEVLEFLRQVDFLNGVSEVSLRRLAEMLVERRYAPGEVVFRQGQAGEEVLLVQSGWIEVGWETSSGEFRRYYTTGPGDAAGILSFIGHRVHSATGRAEEEVCGLALPRSRKEELLSMPEVMFKLLLVYEARRRQMLDMSVDLASASLPELEYRVGAYGDEIAQLEQRVQEIQSRLDQVREQLTAYQQALAARAG